MPNFYQNSILFASQVMHAFEVVRALTNSKNIITNNEAALPSIKKALSELHFNRYQYIIHSLTGQTYTRSKAKAIWLNVLSHQADMICELKRDPGIIVAALDYVENISPIQGSRFVFIEQKELQQLIEMSLLDGLTGLYNRNTFMLLMEKDIQLCKRHQQAAALLLIDLDNFKDINDSNGHQQGDLALVTSAKIIMDSIRAMDIAGRYGGDEFIVFLPDASKHDATVIAERIKKGINTAHNLKQEHGQQKLVSVSIGISHFPNHGENVQDLVYSADMALYRAKNNGKNLVINSS